jgi:Ca-activated chloride channel family protein
LPRFGGVAYFPEDGHPAAPMNPLPAAILVLLLSALAEALHARRVRVAARLAFGPEGASRGWTLVAPFLRCFARAAFAWGLAVMWQLHQAAKDGKPAENKEPVRLIFVADLSPSMYLKDAGPEGKQTRQERMREEVETVLMRVGGDLRYGVIGFYTEAHSVVMDARDPELVRNVFNGLPLQYVMKSGSTDLGTAINAAVKVVDGMPAQTVRLVVFTDGDTIPLQPILPRPKSVKEVLVLGVGNPRKGTFIAGHQSRQDAEVLATVARALRGSYFDVNEKHLPTAALGDLVQRTPLPKSGLNLAQLAVLAMALGSAILALLPVALQYAGSRWRVVRIETEAGEGAAR